MLRESALDILRTRAPSERAPNEVLAVKKFLRGAVPQFATAGSDEAKISLLAEGVEIGKSLVESDFIKTALEVVHAAKARHCEIVLPHDVVVAPRLEAGAPAKTVPTLETPADQMILDVGPKTVTHYTEIIGRCKTLLWNGPLGAFEVAPFGEGTFALARAAATQTKAGKLTSVAGGGDTVAALNAAGVTDHFTYVSTAGGAFLEWLEGRTLPGIAALASRAGKG